MTPALDVEARVQAALRRVAAMLDELRAEYPEAAWSAAPPDAAPADRLLAEAADHPALDGTPGGAAAQPDEADAGIASRPPGRPV